MLNKNQKQRDKLLFDNSVVPYGSGIARFESASLQTVQELITLNFLNPDDKQDNSPSAQDFINIVKDLIKSHPKIAKQIYFHGYVVDKEREDYRTTLEGIGLERGAQDISATMKSKLKLLFRNADIMNFDNGEFLCWYD